MKKTIQSFLMMAFAMLSITATAQNNFFADKAESSMRTANQQRNIVPNNYRTIGLDVAQLKSFLSTVPEAQDATGSTFIITLPMPNGKTERFSVVASSIMAPELAAKYPEITTYRGVGIDDKSASLVMDFTVYGFHAQILSANSGAHYIDPYAKGNVTDYISYKKSDLNPKAYKEDMSNEVAHQITELVNGRTALFGPLSVGTQLRKYRLAIACTNQYAQAVAPGATNANKAGVLAQVVTTTARVTGVYEKELSITFQLIANEDVILFPEAASDPFTGNNDANTLINESQNIIDFNIGTANYDIGHTFSTGGGGLAGLGVVCNASSKARGITGSPAPTGDAYDIDYVAHEMGHQFGGNHTFNFSGNTNATGGCTPANRNPATSVEPGSGTTIMAYAGICPPYDVQVHSDPQFHATSLFEIATYSTLSTGNTCPVTTTTGNLIPVVNAGTNYTIPISTPFKLTGSATDANSDFITYSWEQIDRGAASGANPTNTALVTGPLFRSFQPTSSPSRYFPRLVDVVTNTATLGELLPSVARTMNFRLTARDNRSGGSGVSSGDVIITTNATGGAFTVSSQSTATNWTANGSNTATITWNVGSTTAAPFNTSNVDILFSTDGGYTYPYTLLSNTPNDGTQAIVIPAYNTTLGRVMVRAVGNVFFNINAANITVTSVCGAEGAKIVSPNEVTAPAGNAALNLSLTPQYSTGFASGTITSATAASNLAIPSTTTTGACVVYTNPYKYDSYTFTVSTTGSYTFTNSASFYLVQNIYANSYSVASPCTNFVASSGFVTAGANLSTSVTANLTAGITYVLTIGTFSSTQPALPISYVITTSGAGTVIGSNPVYTNPGAGFSYGYIIVNNATNTIVGFSATPNLTNSTTYPAGSYSVYGISYNNSVTTLNTYVGQNFNNLTSAIASNPSGFCANLSKNAIQVNITSAPLPVTLLGLKARKVNKQTSLTWSTASEQNSDYFLVERSVDGVNFIKSLGSVTAAHNSSTLKNYSLNDVTPSSKWNYYRLKQFDLDGKFTYSNIAAVNFDNPASQILIYPNPAVSQLNVELNSDKADKLSIEIIDSKGAIVRRQTWNVLQGANLTKINIENMAQGAYVLKYYGKDGTPNYTKFIKN